MESGNYVYILFMISSLDNNSYIDEDMLGIFATKDQAIIKAKEHYNEDINSIYKNNFIYMVKSYKLNSCYISNNNLEFIIGNNIDL